MPMAIYRNCARLELNISSRVHSSVDEDERFVIISSYTSRSSVAGGCRQPMANFAGVILSGRWLQSRDSCLSRTQAPISAWKFLRQRLPCDAAASVTQFFCRVYEATHTLTKHECYPPLMCNKFQRSHSNEQVMGITAQMYTTVELMVRLLNNWQRTKSGRWFFHHWVTD